MPQQRTILRRVGRWIRNLAPSHRLEAPEVQEQRDLEERQQRRAAELAIAQRARILNYRRWIERQRHIAHNQGLRTEARGDPDDPGEGPTVLLLHVPEPIERINRSLVLIIEENGVRFKVDIIEVDHQQILWAVSAVSLR